MVRAGMEDSQRIKPTKLHHMATRYVSAKAQAFLVEKMQQAKILTKKELEFYKRGRNAKSHTSAKNTAVVTYRISTGFESLFGYLYLSGQQERLTYLANWCIKTIQEEQN